VIGNALQIADVLYLIFGSLCKISPPTVNGVYLMIMSYLKCDNVDNEELHIATNTGDGSDNCSRIGTELFCNIHLVTDTNFALKTSSIDEYFPSSYIISPLYNASFPNTGAFIVFSPLETTV